MDKQVSRKVLLGKITGLFGVKGWVKVHSDTMPRENIVAYRQWGLKAAGPGSGNGWRTVKVEEGREQGKTVVAKITGVDDRDAAAALIGSIIAVERAELPELADGEFYWTDLLGFEVFDQQSKLLGYVERLFETGANDVMVVQNNRRTDNEEILIPWIRPTVIVDVDLQNRLIKVDWDPDF